MKRSQASDSKRLARQTKRQPANWKTRLRLDNLEERVLLNATVIEDFTGSLAQYTTVYKYYPSAVIVPGAGHDGVSNALVKQDGFEWLIRNDDAVQVHQGETLSVWTQFADAVDGRAYFGFGAVPNGTRNSPLGDGHTLALVLAGNTNQLLFEANDTPGMFGGLSPAPHVLGTPVAQSYNANAWYQMEVVWGTDGSLTGNLYDADGNRLNTVTASSAIASGGIAFRGFGSDKYFDTVTVDDGSGAPHGARHAVHHPVHPSLQHLDATQHHGQFGPTPGDGTGTPVPYDYQSVPNSGRDVALFSFNQLTQIGTTLVNGMVGLSAQNVSAVFGSTQMTWGPGHYSGSGSINPETPYLAQYLFRQRPGEDTALLGSSDVKHFFSSAHSDFQHLNPGEQDTYGSGLNANQGDFFPGSEVDPVTADVHRFDYFGNYGPVDNDGFNREASRTYTSRLQHMLAVNPDDIDPNNTTVNPVGTRWFLMGNLWVAGDQDVTNNSRWVRVVPVRNGDSFSFQYPDGVGGQYDFRTLPGLNGPGAPAIVNSTPSGNVSGPVDTVTVTFNHAIDPSTFTPAQVHMFTGPSGDITVNDVQATDNTNTVFAITFDAQSDFGAYTMVIGPDISDLDGNMMAAAYTARFTISSDLVTNGGFETGSFSGWTQSGNPAFTTVETDLPHSGQYAAKVGPSGTEGFLSQRIATTPGAAYNLDYWLESDNSTPNNQFEAYIDGTVVPGSQLMNAAGFAYREYVFHFMATGATTEVKFGFRNDPSYFHLDDVTVNPFNGVIPPAITNSTPSGNVNGPVSTVTVTFNHAIDPSTFTPAQVHMFTGPSGDITVNDVQPTNNTNTVFAITFDPQTATGAYSMVIGPDISDPDGNMMEAAYTARFTIIPATLITNGGFETGNFTGWTQSGNPNFTTVSNITPHSGIYAAQVGPDVTEGFLSQRIATTPGAAYNLDYWLECDNSTPNNQFEAYIDGVVVPGSQLTNAAAFAYREYTFRFVATGAMTEVKFGFRNDPSYFHLDDVAVNPTTGPGSSGHGPLTVNATFLTTSASLQAQIPAYPVQNSSFTRVEDHRAANLDKFFATPAKSVNAAQAAVRAAGLHHSLAPVDPINALGDTSL